MTDPSHPGGQPPADNIPAALPLVPDHELIRLIGGGSGGQVWLARNALGRYRAVKIVYEKAFRHRRPFDREFNGVLKFEPVSRLHDGLVDILQVGRNDEAGYFYCVMELADDASGEGELVPERYIPRTLAFDLARDKQLPVPTCIYISATIAAGLGFLHRQGLIHRDIKPSNIIFVDGAPKLADTGLVAEMAEARSYVGTEGFIPPEGPGTVQADIYSLGKVLYEISTGKDRNDYPELPDLFGDTASERDLIKLNKIVLKACRRDPGQRYSSADDLMQVLAGFQYSIDDPRAEERREQAVRVIGIAGAVLAAIVITAIVWRLIWLVTHAP